jgi:hypothetical protein
MEKGSSPRAFGFPVVESEHAPKGMLMLLPRDFRPLLPGETVEDLVSEAIRSGRAVVITGLEGDR